MAQTFDLVTNVSMFVHNACKLQSMMNLKCLNPFIVKHFRGTKFMKQTGPLKGEIHASKSMFQVTFIEWIDITEVRFKMDFAMQCYCFEFQLLLAAIHPFRIIYPIFGFVSPGQITAPNRVDYA